MNDVVCEISETDVWILCGSIKLLVVSIFTRAEIRSMRKRVEIFRYLLKSTASERVNYGQFESIYFVYFLFSFSFSFAISLNRFIEFGDVTLSAGVDTRKHHHSRIRFKTVKTSRSCDDISKRRYT